MEDVKPVGQGSGQWRSKLTGRTLFESDLALGTATDSAGRAAALWPADLIQRLRETLEEEAGPAWRRVWKDCGRAWGRRVMEDLDKRCAQIMGCVLDDLPLEKFLEFLTEQVTAQGWGRLEMDLSDGPERGLIRALLINSVFSNGQGSSSGDLLLAGMLASMMSRVSGEELDCVRTEAPGGSPGSRFVITAAERLKGVEERIVAGESPDKVIESI
ncbi:MAG TPA: hypothetical protein PLU30_23980 [Verrucomicrobiae bacterium]|nr:hypothetical protein [Verrucomicrobiae bacterium]